MTIDDAIIKLNELKKLKKLGFGSCELTGFSNDKIDLSITLNNRTEVESHIPVIGFNPGHN